MGAAAASFESPPRGVVMIVDDDASVRSAIARLVRSAGLEAWMFASADEFLAAAKPRAPSCVVLDVAMPGLSGLDLQRALREAGDPLPIVFITGLATVPMSVRAMKDGALEFLTKPFRDEDLLQAIYNALQVAGTRATDRARHLQLAGRYAMVTAREREVMALVVKGLLNKQAAATLGIAEITVKVHRQRVMRKMGAGSLAELVRMAQELGIE